MTFFLFVVFSCSLVTIPPHVVSTNSCTVSLSEDADSLEYTATKPSGRRCVLVAPSASQRHKDVLTSSSQK